MAIRLSRKASAILMFSAALLGACGPTDPEASGVEHFSIAANRVDCVGVGPMRCLLVNGALFYDSIEGYDHVEGQAAEICVTKTRRPDPIPADASSFVYRQVPCEAG